MSQTFAFTKTSLERLKGIHPDLVKVIMRALELSLVPFQITEGLRSLSRQRMLFQQKATRTLRSRHLTGHAVDVVATPGGKVSYAESLYYQIAESVQKASRELNIPVEWGGHFRGFFDGPHFQLPWDRYPATTTAVADLPDATRHVAGQQPSDKELVLIPGVRGEPVMELQRLLNQVTGSELKVDGFFGPKTHAAIRLAQTMLNRPITGSVTSADRAAIEKAARQHARRSETTSVGVGHG